MNIKRIYLNNKDFFNRGNLNNITNEDEEEKNKKIENMRYLKDLAFKESQNKSRKNTANENGVVNTENSVNDVARKSVKKSFNFENEHQLRIGGKIFHMQNQMDRIAKEILNKCKYYSPKKGNEHHKH